jgi:apolipoprotein N-acyltransferase
VLLWAAFFPLDLGFLGFVALVPWLSLVRADVSRRRRYLAAYVGGFVFSALATQWVRVAHPMMYFSWLAFSLVLPLFWVLALDFIRRLDRLGVPLALAVSVAWVALEYARMHFPTGFPFLKPLGLYQMIGFGWYFLGYTQHDFLPLIQIADVGGVYAVSFVVAAVNGAVADWSLRSEVVRKWLKQSTPLTVGVRPAIASSVAVMLLAGASVVYGFVRLQHPEFAPGPRVAAIQGSVPQFEKMEKGMSLSKTYADLHFKALTLNPDLIVWPETCFPDDWIEVVPGQVPPEKFAQVAAECATWFKEHPLHAPTLLGLNGLEWDQGRAWKYNSAVLLDARGMKLGRYDKMHLVPFGEYVPLGEQLPFMRWFTPYTHDYSCRPGESWTRFAFTAADGRTFTFACLICYEDSDPYLGRQYVATQPVDFLVNISNDGWFDGTEEHEQHLAICRFRAIETRRAVVRSVNMGISAVIDSDGRVIALPGETWSKSKKVEGVVSAVVPLDTRESPYARIGDWVPAACWLGLLVGLVALRFRHSGTNTA